MVVCKSAEEVCNKVPNSFDSPTFDMVGVDHGSRPTTPVPRRDIF